MNHLSVLHASPQAHLLQNSTLQGRGLQPVPSWKTTFKSLFCNVRFGKVKLGWKPGMEKRAKHTTSLNLNQKIQHKTLFIQGQQLWQMLTNGFSLKSLHIWTKQRDSNFSLKRIQNLNKNMATPAMVSCGCLPLSRKHSSRPSTP